MTKPVRYARFTTFCTLDSARRSRRDRGVQLPAPRRRVLQSPEPVALRAAPRPATEPARAAAPAASAPAPAAAAVESPPPPIMPFEEAVAFAATHLFSKAELPAGAAKLPLVIDPLVDGDSGSQSVATETMQAAHHRPGADRSTRTSTCSRSPPRPWRGAAAVHRYLHRGEHGRHRKPGARLAPRVPCAGRPALGQDRLEGLCARRDGRRRHRRRRRSSSTARPGRRTRR